MSDWTPLPAELAREHPWFGSLLSAHEFLDAALRDELRRQSRVPACRPGCTPCCMQPIPLTVAEGMGIRLVLDAGLALLPETGVASASERRCPFLRGDQCSIYAVRPFACRRFLVFSRPCAMGEDATAIRPADVHRPSEKALLHALRLTLPVYRALGVAVRGDEERGFFTERTTIIQKMDWNDTTLKP